MCQIFLHDIGISLSLLQIVNDVCKCCYNCSNDDSIELLVGYTYGSIRFRFCLIRCFHHYPTQYASQRENWILITYNFRQYNIITLYSSHRRVQLRSTRNISIQKNLILRNKKTSSEKAICFCLPKTLYL